MTSTATITINVLDAQDSPPAFVGTPYFGYVYEVSVPVSRTVIQVSLQGSVAWTWIKTSPGLK